MHRPLLIPLLGFALLACAEGENLSDAGMTSSVDALFGCTVPPCDGPLLPQPVDADRPPPPPPADAALPPVDAMMIPDNCEPGSRIGPCALCNLDGMPEMPTEDPSCPAIDCGGNAVYERVVEGEEEVCYVTRRTPMEGNCRELGACHDDPVVFCGEPTREEVQRFTPGACISMMGCEGANPPMVEEAAPGAPCNGSGLCRVDGTCTVSAECGSFLLQGNSVLCESGDENGQLYCQFYLEPGGETDCNTFCLNNNWRCARSWNDNGVCVPQNEEAGCGTDYESHICRCIPL